MLHRTQGFTFELGIFTNLEPDHIGPGEHASFEDYLHCKGLLFQQCRVGIVNACLRLKMVSKDEVSFDVDSEQGVGTLILVKIPLRYVTKEENNAESIIGG